MINEFDFPLCVSLFVYDNTYNSTNLIITKKRLLVLTIVANSCGGNTNNYGMINDDTENNKDYDGFDEYDDDDDIIVDYTVTITVMVLIV